MEYIFILLANKGGYGGLLRYAPPVAKQSGSAWSRHQPNQASLPRVKGHFLTS